MQLIAGRGDGHGHIHHRPQGGDENTADQKSADVELGVVGPQHQLLRLGHVEAIHGRECAGCRGEKPRRGHAAHASQGGAQGLFGEAGQKQQGSRRGESDDPDGGRDGRDAAQEQRHQHEPHAGHSVPKAQHRHGALFPADQHQKEDKDSQQAKKHQAPVIIGHRDDVGRSAVVQIQPYDDPGPLPAIHVGVGVEVVHRLHD